MVGQRGAPGVQYGGQADARAQMLRVGGDRGQRLRGGPEQEVVDGRLVLERDGADRGRQGEDDVIVGNRQELGLAPHQRWNFPPVAQDRGGSRGRRYLDWPVGSGCLDEAVTPHAGNSQQPERAQIASSPCSSQ